MNVVVAEIRLPENKSKDTHNLGKSLLGRMLDFCFLAGREPEFFLFKYPELFEEFVFFLEIELFDHSYLTIRRSIKSHSKICFKKHLQNDQDFSWYADDQPEWDHCEIPFKHAKTMLDGWLDLKTIASWDYRDGLGYLVRSQNDYTDVFRLSKFKGKHADWKPYLMQILGFDGPLLREVYQIGTAISEEQVKVDAIRYELNVEDNNQGKLDGLLLLKKREIAEKTRLLGQMSFHSADAEKTRTLVDEVDIEIVRLNSERYRLMQLQKSIRKSLEDKQILFDPEKARSIFHEVGVLFDGQIKKDFEQLIAFNRAISTERHQYLKDELTELEIALSKTNSELLEKENIRSKILAFLGESDVFDKYKQCSDELVYLRSEVESLERLRSGFQRVEKMQAEIHVLKEREKELRLRFEKNVSMMSSEDCSRFSSIRIFFDEIIKTVINRNALLNVSINKEGNPDFQSPILDEKGSHTSAAEGHSYMRLLCVAFDLAVSRSYLDDRYPHFIFHDGVLEGLETRKKENLFEIIKQYSQLGIQYIVTLLDSEIPPGDSFFDESDVILRLHDEGQDGRLFKMDSW
jgi:uncharacterized protein YydD (DUF2326 family)